MIQVRVVKSNGSLTGLQISGHSGSAERGKDLVCAAVSGIAFGLLNALDELVPSSQIEVSDNLITVNISAPDERSELVMKTGLIQFKTVEEANKKYIKVKMEV